MKVNWGYGWSNMMGQIGYPRPPLPTGVRIILTAFWLVVGLILAMPFIFAALFAVGILFYILQPNVSNPSDRPITSPPLVALVERGVNDARVGPSGEVIGVATDRGVEVLDAESGAVIDSANAFYGGYADLVGWRQGELWARRTQAPAWECAGACCASSGMDLRTDAL